jgi:hypothetical protein
MFHIEILLSLKIFQGLHHGVILCQIVAKLDNQDAINASIGLFVLLNQFHNCSNPVSDASSFISSTNSLQNLTTKLSDFDDTCDET